ncbi:hypothetical protein FQA39_LY07761 [Lamprigera yunnana]|nr:hypothetical protein FQA39_LY07761 [Lamprigera yunnana]
MNVNWTEKEKEQLHDALQVYGTNDIDLITSLIPSRSKSEVQYTMQLYEAMAMKTVKNEGDRNREAAIDSWLKFFKESSTNCTRGNELVTAVRILALLEEEEEGHNSINLRRCYEYIADLMSGKVPKSLNKESNEFLALCINKLGALLKREDVSEELEFVNNLNLPQKPNPNNTKDGVNLLKVPPKFLKLNLSADQC